MGQKYWTADLEITGGAQIVDLVSTVVHVVRKDDVVDHPVDLRRRHSAGLTRDVALAAGPRILDAAVIARKPWRNCSQCNTDERSASISMRLDYFHGC